VLLQESGLLISRKAHGAHHKSPFNCNYSIVSGMWNPVLDGDNPGQFQCFGTSTDTLDMQTCWIFFKFG
jgi:sterol desaturase/sphingolipid hydroxylase (fatty acid hydroxylase superfamily)